jgi:hypothetical protein
MKNVLDTGLTETTLLQALMEIRKHAQEPIRIRPTQLLMSDEIAAQVRRMAADAGMTPQEFIDAVLAGTYL